MYKFDGERLREMWSDSESGICDEQVIGLQRCR